MRSLHVVAAGLGYRMLERHGMLRMAGLAFEPGESVFPALTCVAQATLRTGLGPEEHGMVANGWWSEELRRPFFWEQSCRIVKGERRWGADDGVFFFQQSLGENVKAIVSPAPVHRHDGSMAMGCYTRPSGMDPVLRRLAGKFPLWRYWGPLASPKIGRRCIDYFEQMTAVHDVEDAYLYLPTLDYAAQRSGPDSPAARAALKEFRRQLERIADLAMRRGCGLSVEGDYEITPTTMAPALPNVCLRRHGLFRTRTVGGRSYPDFHQSSAFAMCDHEVAVVVGPERDRACELLLSTGEYERQEWLADGRHCVLLAKSGGWCGYEWWTDAREAPDFAAHVDIHNKPGYDPKELFWFNRGTVLGTHGRKCEIACAGERRGPGGGRK